MAEAEAGNSAPIESLLEDLVAHGVRSVAENGVLGDPTGASGQEGWEMLLEAVVQLSEEIAPRPRV
jgi:creatinine amidohydrolase